MIEDVTLLSPERRQALIDGTNTERLATWAMVSAAHLVNDFIDLDESATLSLDRYRRIRNASTFLIHSFGRDIEDFFCGVTVEDLQLI